MPNSREIPEAEAAGLIGGLALQHFDRTRRADDEVLSTLNTLAQELSVTPSPDPLSMDQPTIQALDAARRAGEDVQEADPREAWKLLIRYEQPQSASD